MFKNKTILSKLSFVAPLALAAFNVVAKAADMCDCQAFNAAGQIIGEAYATCPAYMGSGSAANNSCLMAPSSDGTGFEALCSGVGGGVYASNPGHVGDVVANKVCALTMPSS